jgi:hypothetical protein
LAHGRRKRRRVLRIAGLAGGDGWWWQGAQATSPPLPPAECAYGVVLERRRIHLNRPRTRIVTDITLITHHIANSHEADGTTAADINFLFRRFSTTSERFYIRSHELAAIFVNLMKTKAVGFVRRCVGQPRGASCGL